MRSPEEAEQLWQAALTVLRGCDRSGRIVPGRPTHGRWPSPMTAMGIARADVPRAVAELRAILAVQAPTGMVPHSVTPAGDLGRICPPPAHAIAVRAVLDRGHDNGGSDLALAEKFAGEAFPALLTWHRWLATARDPDGWGLVEIHHPWESSWECSQRWDEPLRRVGPDPHATPAERHQWLFRQLRYTGAPPEFRVRDVFFSAMLAAATEVLAGLADEVGRTDTTAELHDLAARFREGVAAAVDPRTGLARDFDVTSGTWISTASAAGFAPLLAGGDPALLAAQRALLLGEDWMGHPVLRHALPPTTSPASPDFRRQSPWRGPTWPVLDLMLGWASVRDSAWDVRALLRGAALDQLGDSVFGEFYEPVTGAALGSRGSPWTAAAVLEWLG